MKKELKNNKKIMLEALNNDEHYIYYASKELKDDKELLEIYFEYFPVENANDYDFYKECELKLKLLKEQEWLEQNAPKNIIKSKPGKF